METTLALVPEVDSMDKLIEMALATCPSPRTRRCYGMQLRKFIASGHSLTREGLAAHLQAERARGNGISTLTGAVAAVRKLAAEAHIRGLLTSEELAQVKSVNPGKRQKSGRGMWLTIAQTQKLLSLPDRTTYWGKRDAAILCILLGCGLRRAEMAALRWDQYQSREERMCLVDIMGKGNKLRTLPVPSWAVESVNEWREASQSPQPPVDLSQTYLEYSRKRDPLLVCGGVGEETLYQLVRAYGQLLKLDLAPHDLRRTLAQLLRKGGAPLEQIQAMLGHESISTTTIYLGSTLELGDGLAAVDKLKLKLGRGDE